MSIQRLLLTLLTLVILTGCSETSLDPFENDDRFYSIFGYLDSRQTDHQIRLIPITRFAENIEAWTPDVANLDARVTSTDLSTGSQTRWTYSLERLEDGDFGHIFRSKFIVRPGRTYRLEVTRSDGTITSAETTVPRFPITVPNPDTLFYPYEIAPDSGEATSVYLPDIASPWDMFVTYDLQGTFIRLPYGRPGSRTDDGGWVFDIDMAGDAPRMRDELGLPPGSQLPLLHAILLQVRALDSNWDPPNGVFDPEILAQPGTMSNVENGYGFWGSIGLYQYTWIAPPSK